MWSTYKRLPLVLVVFLGLATGSARAEETYYMMVFASQGEPNQARLAHTFATFVKVSGSGKNATDAQIESRTISWLPETLNIVVLRRFPERGKNFDLKATMAWIKSINAKVYAWGPYRIEKELFDRANKRIEHLDSGQIGFKAIDRGFRPDSATNCFHAVSDIVDKELLMTGTAFGVNASRLVLMHLSPWIINPQETHDWLRERLGLEPVP